MTYHKRANWPTHAILSKYFINKNIVANCIQTGVAFPFKIWHKRKEIDLKSSAGHSITIMWDKLIIELITITVNIFFLHHKKPSHIIGILYHKRLKDQYHNHLRPRNTRYQMGAQNRLTMFIQNTNIYIK